MKPVDDIDSFRPLNNLCCLEKLCEQWIKQNFVHWLEEESVIIGDHHGGRQGYSTLTAIANINYQISRSVDQKNHNVLLTTDLSAAFDTIDHMTLLRKLEHYAVRGKELSLFICYLSNRRQFVEVDTFRSEVHNCHPAACKDQN